MLRLCREYERDTNQTFYLEPVHLGHTAVGMFIHPICIIDLTSSWINHAAAIQSLQLFLSFEPFSCYRDKH